MTSFLLFLFASTVSGSVWSALASYRALRAERDLFRHQFAPRIGLPVDYRLAAIEAVCQVPIYQQRMFATIYGLDSASFPEPPPLTPTTTTNEPIIGWRMWHIVDDPADPQSLVLYSVHVPYFWPRGKAAQADRLDAHYVDRPTGLHAARHQVQARYCWPLPGFPRAYGTVALWGRVIEHEHGYRAEFAYPQHLYVADEATAQALRRAYGCEVEVEVDPVFGGPGAPGSPA